MGLSMEDVKGAYARAKRSLLGSSSLRDCERDVYDLLEMETDWSGVRDSLAAAGVSDGDGLDEAMLSRAADDMSRARASVCFISDAQYDLIKCRYDSAPQPAAGAAQAG